MLEAASQHLTAPAEEATLGKRSRPAGHQATDDEPADEEVQRFLKAIELDDEKDKGDDDKPADDNSTAPQLIE